MEIAHISQEYIQAVKDIKSAILKSRYAAAKQANKELLKLYYSVGGYVSAHSRDGYWGSNAIDIGAATPLRPSLKDCNRSCRG